MSGLITLEGLDGSGKATQTRLLYDELAGRGIKARLVSFPNYSEASSAPVKMYLDGEFGKNPGDVNAYAASSFFAVDRYASFVKHWRADYQSGTLILADRYTTSNIIYQMSKLPKKQWNEFITWLCDFEYGKLGLPKPELTIYLDMEPEISQRLLDKRYCGDIKKKDIHESNTAYLSDCRESAAYAARLLNWRTVNCVENGKLKSAESIHTMIMKIILEEPRLYV